MTEKVYFSSKTVEWATPRSLFVALDAIFSFTLDPCATVENATCARFFTREDDGLSKAWDGERVFMNPPYGRDIGRWVKKAAQSEALVVCLLPARTDTRWWHDHVEHRASSIHFLKGRQRFGDARASAPFPSVIIVFTGQLLRDHGVQRPASSGIDLAGVGRGI